MIALNPGHDPLKNQTPSKGRVPASKKDTERRRKKNVGRYGGAVRSTRLPNKAYSGRKNRFGIFECDSQNALLAANSDRPCAGERRDSETAEDGKENATRWIIKGIL
ncbi:hypothetical protein GWI33_004255 [Rhynchophorus ferrugineus]|uniref:Uncharacterized protein n=1 Tax=Rhynchophorus ferrugineus TaxID=354439 RepID=A0A834IXE3_RHYFE|nr:hypothetical protein GWI33_004255 [Rhynchophorus ferrugineus]